MATSALARQKLHWHVSPHMSASVWRRTRAGSPTFFMSSSVVDEPIHEGTVVAVAVAPRVVSAAVPSRAEGSGIIIIIAVQ